MSALDISALISICLFFCPVFIFHENLKPFQSRTWSVISIIFLYLTTRILYKLIHATILYPYYLSPLLHLPHPAQRGVHKRFFSEPSSPQLEEWMNKIPNSGLIRYYARFNGERILVTSPQGHDELLQSKARFFPKSPITQKILKMWVGENSLLGSLDGEGHKGLRKKLLPAFYARHIKDLQPVFWRKAGQFCDELHALLPKKGQISKIPLESLIDRISLDIVGLAGHGVDFNSITHPDGEIHQLHRRAFDLGDAEIQVVISALLLPGSIFSMLPFKVYRENRAGVVALREHCLQAIRAEASAKDSLAASKDILTVASQTDDTLSETELVDIAIDLLVAGHKTVSSALQLAFYTLAQHPDIQSRLREEIRTFVPYPKSNSNSNSSTNSHPSIEITQLPYLNAVTTELLRLYPPLPSTNRLTLPTNPPVTLCNQPIPSGSIIGFSPWAMNRNRHIWGEDAAEFRPERWLEQRAKPTLLTFSKGPRNCIGEGFAREEIRWVVAAVVGRFELSIPASDGEGAKGVKQGITIHVEGGCRVGVKELEGW